jgi:hypothetical protein
VAADLVDLAEARLGAAGRAAVGRKRFVVAMNVDRSFISLGIGWE